MGQQRTRGSERDARTTANRMPGGARFVGWLTAMLLAAGLGAWTLLLQAETPGHNAAPTSLTAPPTNLPVVTKVAPQQPPVGLPTDTHLDKTPPRQTAGLDLVKSGWTYNCMECHKLFPAKWHYDRPMNEHKHITLDHGNNRFCLNCHHPKNRNAFVDYDGAEIAEADVVLLCAKCHGPTYRDWEAGVHGRQNGFWKAEAGAKTKLRCIQCHDPHSPQFKAMKPLAPLRYPSRAAGGNPSHGAAPHAPAASGAATNQATAAATAHHPPATK